MRANPINDAVVHTRTRITNTIAFAIPSLGERIATITPSWRISEPGSQKNKFEAIEAAAQAAMTYGSIEMGYALKLIKRI